MTSKLKCPFCGEEIKIAGERTTIMSCFNGECCGSGLYGEEAMWQALIQAKQDLEIAREALKNISLGNLSSLPDDETISNAMCNYARDAIKRIEHKEK